MPMIRHWKQTVWRYCRSCREGGDGEFVAGVTAKRFCHQKPFELVFLADLFAWLECAHLRFTVCCSWAILVKIQGS